MIIKGNPAGNVGYWSKHLLRDDTNARAEVKEISGLLAGDLPSALREMQAIAAQSRSHGNFMYQANINPYDYEHLTPEQWKEAVATLEKNLGLEGHQRVVVEHFKEGRQHYHIVWNRVDVDSLRVADMGGNYRIHTATARELESRFDLTPTPTQPAPDRKPALELWEVRAAERSGIDPAALKAELSALLAQHRQRQGVRRRARRARLYLGERRPPRFLRHRPGGRRALFGAPPGRREGEGRARAHGRRSARQPADRRRSPRGAAHAPASCPPARA